MSKDSQESFIKRHWPELLSGAWSVLGGLFMGSVIGFFLGVPIFFIATLMAVELATRSPRLVTVRQKAAELAGIQLSTADNTTASTLGILQAKPDAADHLAKLWLYERRSKHFDALVNEARAAIPELEELFFKAMDRQLDQGEKRKLDNAEHKFISNLEGADKTYEGCFMTFKNMSMTNPYHPSTYPLPGIERLTDQLKKDYRAFQDRLNSLARHEDEMKQQFQHAINATQGEISRAAHEAIKREKQG